MNNKKESHIALSSRSSGPPMSHIEEVLEDDSQLNDKKDKDQGPSTPESPCHSNKEMHDPPSSLIGTLSQHVSRGFISERLGDMQDDVAEWNPGEQLFPTLPSSAIRGQGKMPSYGRCDIALEERLGRQETCIVKAASTAFGWRRKGSGGKTYNKPIVIDLDLPAWDSVSDI